MELTMYSAVSSIVCELGNTDSASIPAESVSIPAESASIPAESASILRSGVPLFSDASEAVTSTLVGGGGDQENAREMLVDSLGYRYNVKERGRTTIYWQCTVRPKGGQCRATVKQVGEDFQPGLRSHNHPADVGALMAAKIRTSVKRKAMDQLFRPATAIVEEIIDYLL